MSYIKQNWKNGDIITAEKLNHMEDGIEGAETFTIPLVVKDTTTPLTFDIDESVTFEALYDAINKNNHIIITWSDGIESSGIAYAYASQAGAYLLDNNYTIIVTSTYCSNIGTTGILNYEWVISWVKGQSPEVRMSESRIEVIPDEKDEKVPVRITVNRNPSTDEYEFTPTSFTNDELNIITTGDLSLIKLVGGSSDTIRGNEYIASKRESITNGRIITWEAPYFVPDNGLDFFIATVRVVGNTISSADCAVYTIVEADVELPGA